MNKLCKYETFRIIINEYRKVGKKQQPRFKNQQNPQRTFDLFKHCINCGKFRHDRGEQFAAFGKMCNFCRKPNHLVSVCLKSGKRRTFDKKQSNVNATNIESTNQDTI